MTREDIIRRAQGIFALSKNGGEQEMLTAAAMLQLFMGKYGLTMSDIEKVENSEIEDCEIAGKYNETWRRTCFSAAARMFMCKYYFVPVGTKTVGIYHHIVGQPHNVAVATEIAAYFEATINRLANEASRQSGLDRDQHTSRHQFIRAFRLNAANRVFTRVLEYVKAAKQGELIDPETGTNVPSLLSLYDLAEMLIRTWEQETGLELSSHTSRDKQLSDAGAKAGKSAGDKISFTTQVTQASAGLAITHQ